MNCFMPKKASNTLTFAQDPMLVKGSQNDGL